MRAWVPIALACATLAVARPGAAQDAKADARRAYDEGERLTRERRYAEAAASFARADDLLPNDTALEAALEAALRADDPVLGMNLRERTRRAPSAEAMPVTRKVAEAFSQRAALVDVPCVEEAVPCRATIDERVATTRRTWVTPGPHRVSLRQADRTQDDEVTVPGGSTATVVLRAPEEPMPAPQPTIAPPTTSDAPDDEGGLSPWWFAAGCAATAVLGGLTIGHGVAASSNKSDFDDGVAAGASRAELEQLAADGDSLETRTNVFLVGTAIAATATAAVALFAVDWTGDDAPRALVVPTPGGVHAVAVGSF
jgi:hypothetical protein